MRRILLLFALAAAAPADDDLLDRLLRALREGDAAAADAAHEALRGMGREAWPRLMPLLDDPDPEVRLRAGRLWEALAADQGDWWGLPVRGATFRDGLPTKVLHRATGIEMVLVPPGSFVSDQAPDGPPVTIADAFYISACEVTQQEFRNGWPDGFLFFSPERAGLPVTGISWDGIQPWLRRTGLRLPTEAEWEYAARAGRRSVKPVRDAARICVFAGAGDPNAFGLRGTEDNVAEWCADDAGDGARVVRGGSFADPGGAPLARRTLPAARRSPAVGFRVVRDP